MNVFWPVSKVGENNGTCTEVSTEEDATAGFWNTAMLSVGGGFVTLRFENEEEVRRLLGALQRLVSQPPPPPTVSFTVRHHRDVPF